MIDAHIVQQLLVAAGTVSVDFLPYCEGVEIHELYATSGEGPSAALLRYAPEARIPAHEHVGYEHIFVLTGSQIDEHGVYAAGTLVINKPGSRHSVYSPQGCTVLAIWQTPVKFLGDEP